MEKPSTKHIWRCVIYYLWLCLAKGQASDTIRGKKSGLKKFYYWAVEQGVRYIDQINLDFQEQLKLKETLMVKYVHIIIGVKYNSS